MLTNKLSKGLFIILVCASFGTHAARPSLKSLQAEVDSLNAQTADLQQQIDSIPAVGETKYEFVGFTSETFDGGH